MATVVSSYVSNMRPCILSPFSPSELSVNGIVISCNGGYKVGSWGRKRSRAQGPNLVTLTVASSLAQSARCQEALVLQGKASAWYRASKVLLHSGDFHVMAVAKVGTAKTFWFPQKGQKQLPCENISSHPIPIGRQSIIEKIACAGSSGILGSRQPRYDTAATASSALVNGIRCRKVVHTYQSFPIAAKAACLTCEVSILGFQGALESILKATVRKHNVLFMYRRKIAAASASSRLVCLSILGYHFSIASFTCKAKLG